MPSTTTRYSEDEDYYRILGVMRDVDDEGLKRAYKRQALRWHPDKNQHRSDQAAEQFKKVSEAYQALSDKQSRAIYNQRRPSAGSNEVLFSKTYGWSGVNISFYWRGPPPEEAEAEGRSPQKAGSTESESSPQRRSKAKKRPNDNAHVVKKSPLELFGEMFDMESPLAKKLDGIRRHSSIFESVFGSFASFEMAKEEPIEMPKAREEEQRPWNKAGCTTAMQEKDKRMAFIQEEYQRGDLKEDEYQELIGLFSAP